MQDNTSKQAHTHSDFVERLAIVVTGNNESKLLSVPKISNGTGKAQADAVFQTLVEWNLTDKYVKIK